VERVDTNPLPKEFSEGVLAFEEVNLYYEFEICQRSKMNKKKIRLRCRSRSSTEVMTDREAKTTKTRRGN
jgi:hypothetical protein